MKILVAIANYGTKNIGYAQQLIDTYDAFHADVDVVVLSNVTKDFGPGVEVRVGLPCKDPWSLPFGHRELFAERQDDYDLFIYSEDDTEITERHVEAFLSVTKVLPQDKIAGFIRYEQAPDGTRYYSTVHAHYYWDPNSVFRIGGHTFAQYTNDHSGCYILTREQLKRCIASGEFVIPPHKGRYDMLVSAATDPYARCGMQKVVCISQLEDFCLHHLADIYLGRIGIEAGEIDRQIEKLMQLEDHIGERGPLFDSRTHLAVSDLDKKYFEPFRPEVTEVIPRSAKRLLSIGCERGLTEGRLVEAGHDVTAVPLDCVIAESARMRGVETISPDFDAAVKDLDGRKFDGLIFNNVVSYLPDPPDIMRKYLPFLERDGLVFVAFDNFAHLSMVKRWLGRDPIALRLRLPHGFEQNGLHSTDERLIKAWLNRAGLRPERVHYRVEANSAKYSRWSLGLCKRWFGRRGVVIARLEGPGNTGRGPL